MDVATAQSRTVPAARQTRRVDTHTLVSPERSKITQHENMLSCNVKKFSRNKTILESPV